jgi:hypothetical protein
MAEVEMTGRWSEPDIDWFEKRLRGTLSRMAGIRDERVQREAGEVFRLLAGSGFQWDTLRVDIVPAGLWIGLISGDGAEAAAQVDDLESLPVSLFGVSDGIGGRVRIEDWPGVRFGGPELSSLRLDIDR